MAMLTVYEDHASAALWDMLPVQEDHRLLYGLCAAVVIRVCLYHTLMTEYHAKIITVLHVINT